MMAFIFGIFMAIGGVVLCFAGKLELGIALYGIAAFCLAATDISIALSNKKESSSVTGKAAEFREALNLMKEIDRVLDKHDLNTK